MEFRLLSLYLPGLVGLHVPEVNLTGKDADSKRGPL